MTETPLVVAKGLVVLMGLFIAYQGYKGYTQYKSKSMLYVASGFVLVSVGTVCESMLTGTFGLTVFMAEMTHYSVVVLGMCSFLYSLYGDV